MARVGGAGTSDREPASRSAFGRHGQWNASKTVLNSKQRAATAPPPAMAQPSPRRVGLRARSGSEKHGRDAAYKMRSRGRIRWMKWARVAGLPRSAREREKFAKKSALRRARARLRGPEKFLRK